MSKQKAKFADFEDPEFLGEISKEACKDLEPEFAAVEKGLRAALGADQETFFKYEELFLKAMNAVQRFTVKKMQQQAD
jgi:hypothetical protein